MRTNELMIGDWVMIKDYPMRSMPKKVREEHFVRSLVEFEPIPITEEILMSNGFVRNEWFLLSIPFGEYNFILEGSTSNNETIFCINIYSNHIQLRYVHELQHALRLCGLNELADNFKIM